MNDAKNKIAEVTNHENKTGKMGDVIEGCDIFIGVSQEKALHGHQVSKMAQRSIVFALANPIPLRFCLETLRDQELGSMAQAEVTLRTRSTTLWSSQASSELSSSTESKLSLTR